MPLDVAEAAINIIFKRTPPHENIDIGFFGGEPLLEFELIQSITHLIKSHVQYDSDRVTLSIITNGTIINPEIEDFVNTQKIEFCISCDGPPAVQDRFRRFPNGDGSSVAVEECVRRCVDAFSTVVANAVYTPETISELPVTVEYLSSLGIRRMFLSPDFSANWTAEARARIERSYRKVADRYVEFYVSGQPHFISVIDNKITVMLRGGYQPCERCRMGSGELAFAPSGNVYPCERLIGGDDGATHCIGHVSGDLNPRRMAFRTMAGGDSNAECKQCGIRDYCMNWCGCSNYFSSGYYNRVNSFLCASEQAAVRAALGVLQRLENEAEGAFVEHMAGRPHTNALAAPGSHCR